MSFWKSLTKKVKRENKVMSLNLNQQSFVIGYHKGSPYIKCLTCGTASFHPGDIKEKYCKRCQKYHALPFNENGNPILPREEPREEIKSTPQDAIKCKSCESWAYKQPDSQIYVCANGHKNAIFGLVEEKKPEPKIEKKKRSLQHNCPYCGKVAEMIEEKKVFGKLFRKYNCGCTECLPITAPPLGRDNKWNEFLPFQKEGIEFVENANYAALIGDEMGLGKTVQALGILRYNYSELTPCLIIVEAAKVFDWKSEFATWVGDKYNEVNDEPIIHDKGSYGLCPGFKNHIISMSLINKPKVLKSILEYGFKFIIVDESHSFKNEDADRTYALQTICKDVDNYVFLSGTPIMNRVEEFFTTLNILRPSHFPSKHTLLNKCDRTSSGRVLGIAAHHRDRFFQLTSQYVIRRTKKQVGIQLPKLAIHKLLLAVDRDAQLIKQYNKQLDFLEEILNQMKSSLASQSEILGIFAKLRHITGIMKVKPVIAYVHEFMESTDPDSKIAIGVHHKDVMDYLKIGLKEYNPICVSDEDGLTKARRIEDFKHPNHRLAILSILGAGQGLNIQFCKNAIQAERQWNPAKEDQFHGRFHRIVKDENGKIVTEFTEDDAVVIDIINAKDTIDEFFDATVELKGKIVGSTDENEPVVSYEFMMELANKLVSSRMKMGV